MVAGLRGFRSIQHGPELQFRPEMSGHCLNSLEALPGAAPRADGAHARRGAPFQNVACPVQAASTIQSAT